MAGCLTFGHGAVLAQSDQVASGLIVKLKPAAQEGALQNLAQAKARFTRLGRLSQKAGYTRTMPWRHIDAQTMVLTTPTALTPALQKTLTDRLMATGQVEWVVPNVRQQMAAISDPDDAYWPRTSPPNQPWDTGLQSYQDKQWWMLPDDQGRRGAPNIRGAWDVTTGSNQVVSSRAVVAVLDTGIALHEDLPVMGAATVAGSSNILAGYDFVSNSNFSGDGDGWDASAIDPGDSVNSSQAAQTAFRQAGCGVQDNSWHGSVVAGLLAAKTDNVTGVAGVNWHARVMPVRVAGKCGADLSDIVAGMYWAAGLDIPEAVRQQERSNAASAGYAAPTVFPPGQGSARARIVNISFGGAGACDSLYQQAIDALAQRNVLVVASAGNEHGAVSRPANCRGVVAVAALNRNGFKSSYSNFGSEITVSTLGGDPSATQSHPDGGAWGSVLGDAMLLSIFPDGAGNPYAFHAGTSYSAPIVSGIVSLMLDVNPALSVADIIQGLQVSARPHVTSSRMGACSNDNPGRCICTTGTCGAGIVDAYEAVQFASARLNAQAYARLTPGAVRLDNDGDVDVSITTALTLAAQDRPANPPVATNGGNSTSSVSSGGGGGGALSLWDLLLLPMLGVWVWVNPRRQ
jgi:serine protease